MPTITNTHDEPYSGSDPGDGGKPLNLAPGASADVSDAKAAQLLADFPDRFKRARKKPAPAAAGELPINDDAINQTAAEPS